MKKLITLILAAAMICGIFSGCGSSEEEAYVPTGDALLMEDDDPASYLAGEVPPQEFSLAYNPDRSMNPLIGYSFNNRVLFSLMYQGLFAIDSKNNPTPILCSSFKSSPSNMIWTFFIEENATFSDGSKVTVDDVIASYEAARVSDYYKGRFIHVDSISISDEGGVKFSLTTAYENFPLLLDVPIVKAGDTEAANPRGTGPYLFSEGLAGHQLSKVPAWWCGNTKIPVRADVIPLVEATSDSGIRDEFEFGDVGLVCTNPLLGSYADYRCDFEMWEVDNGVFLYLGCNVLYSDYFKNSDKLQKALTYAIDRETLNQKNYRGNGKVSTLAVSPMSPYYSESLASNYSYDSMKFLDMISGWTPPPKEEGAKEERKLKLLVNCDDSARLRTARDIAKTLTELGIPCGTLEYSGTTHPTYEEVLRAGTYDIYLGQTRLSPNYNLCEFFRLWGNLSAGGLPVQSILDMCTQSLANSGNYYNLLKKIADDGRIVPILFGKYNVYANRGLFDGLAPSRDNAFFYSLGKTMADARIPTDYD